MLFISTLIKGHVVASFIPTVDLLADQRSVIKVSGRLRNVNRVKFTVECVMCTKKYVFFPNGQNMGLPQGARIEKTVHEVETFGLFSKFY